MCHTLQMGSIFASDEMGSNELQSELNAISQPIEGSFALIFFFFFFQTSACVFRLYKTVNEV